MTRRKTQANRATALARLELNIVEFEMANVRHDEPEIQRALNAACAKLQEARNRIRKADALMAVSVDIEHATPDAYGTVMRAKALKNEIKSDAKNTAPVTRKDDARNAVPSEAYAVPVSDDPRSHHAYDVKNVEPAVRVGPTVQPKIPWKDQSGQVMPAEDGVHVDHPYTAKIQT